MKDADGKETFIRDVLKWLRTQRCVSFSWLRKQYKLVESDVYTMEEWTKFLVESKTKTEKLPHMNSITPEWTLLEREWLVESLIRKLTSHNNGKPTPLHLIEYGVELYFMMSNFAQDLFRERTIKKLNRIVTTAITKITNKEVQNKMTAKYDGLFKESVARQIRKQNNRRNNKNGSKRK